MSEEAAVQAYKVSMDKVIDGKLTLTRREDYRWGFYDGWKANPGIDTTQVTRVEVIAHNGGRDYVNMDTGEVTVQLQDDGKTLKVFVRKHK
jgi:hypothetical protein